MKFSFIIGTINRTRELKYCIESLLTQSYREFEIIIVDQSENDLTEKLVKRKLDNKGPAFHIIAKVVAFPFTYSDRAKNEGVGKATHYYIRKIVKKIIIQKRGRNHI